MYRIPRDTLDFGHRYLRAMRYLNLNDKERLVISAMLLDRNPWRVQTLAAHIGYTRAATRAALDDLAQVEMVTRDPATGWSLTEGAVQCLHRILGEALAIARRERRAFSPALLEALEAKNSLGPVRPFGIPRDVIF